MESAATGSQLDVKGRYDHDFRRCCDIGELRMHFGTDVFERQRIDALPGLLVVVEYHLQHALDDALFGRREVAAFDTAMEAPISAK